MPSQYVIEVTDANFDSVIASGVTLVDFWASWCDPCLMQGQIIEKVAERFAGRANVGKANIDACPSLSSRFGIESIPTLILFRNGQAIGHFEGVQSEQTLANVLEQNLVGVARDSFVKV